MTSKNKVLLYTFVICAILVTIVICLSLYFSHSQVSMFDNKQVANILSSVSTRSEPYNSQNNMLDSGSLWGYDDIWNAFAQTCQAQLPIEEDFAIIDLANKIISKEDFRQNQIYGGFYQIVKDNMSMPISVYTENNIIISCAKIYFDNEKVTNFEEYKIIIDFDQSTNEYVATIISHDYLSNKMTISTYYRKFGGYVYICAQSDFDIGAKQFDIYGYDTINNVGMTTEEYNNMSQTFKESCNHFFLTEIAKLNSVYFNIFENKSTNINYNQDEMLFIQTLNI